MKLPARLKGMPRIDIGHLSVFTERLFTASAVATRHNRRAMAGYCIIKGKRVYWVRYGFVNDPSAYRRR